MDTYIILVLTIFTISSTIAFLFENKKRTRNKQNLRNQIKDISERYARQEAIQEEILSCSETAYIENSFFIKMNNIAKLIGVYFESEYCAIGIVNENIITDITTYFKNELTSEQKKKYENVKSGKIEDTIIGKVLLNREEIKTLDKEEINKLANRFTKVYEENLLPSRSILNSTILGFYNGTAPVGYLQLINYKNIDPNYIKSIGRSLKSIIINSLLRYMYENKIRDDQFINQLIFKSKDNIEGIIDQTMFYLANEMNCGIISFRIPIPDGNQLSNETGVLFILRRYYVDPKFEIRGKLDECYKERKVLKSNNISYFEYFNEHPGVPIYFDESNNTRIIHKDVNLTALFEKTNIVIPIYKKKVDPKKNWWENIYGVFNLRPYAITNKEIILKRTENLTFHISNILSNALFLKNHLRLIELKLAINHLNFNDTVSFFNQISILVKNVVESEICSIFLYNKNDNTLRLKATTALKARYKENIININEITLEDVYYDLEEKESLIVQVFQNRQARYIYDVSYINSYSRKFIEILDDINDHSLLIVPIYDTNFNCVGIIKCIGKSESQFNLINSFWEFDKEFIEFLGGILARFIDNVQITLERYTFIKQFLHELITPVGEMIYSHGLFFNRINRGVEKKDILYYAKSAEESLWFLQSLLNDLDFITTEQSKKIEYNFNKLNTKETFIQTVRLLEQYASAEKQITLRLNISDLPDLIIDKEKFKQVVINLLKNAIKYSDENTIIQVFYKPTVQKFSTYQNDNWHELEFVNYGLEIIEKEKDEIFKIFKRGSNSSRKSPAGSGIGLFVVNEIMKAHKGLCLIRSFKNPIRISILFPK